MAASILGPVRGAAAGALAARCSPLAAAEGGFVGKGMRAMWLGRCLVRQSSSQPRMEGAGDSMASGEVVSPQVMGQPKTIRPNLQPSLAPVPVQRHYPANPALLIDTHAMVIRFEQTGLSRAQAETLTSTIAEAVTAALHRIHDEHSSKFELEKVRAAPSWRWT